MRRHIYFATILSILFSCDNKSSKRNLLEYSQGRQLLTVNNINRDGSDFTTPKIQKITPDSIKLGDEFVAKIFLTETHLVLADAFVDCDSVENPSVDTLTFTVSGCKNRLMVKDDTIVIGFRPTTAGLKTFATITILTKDNEKIFRTMKYTFDYNVVEN